MQQPAINVLKEIQVFLEANPSEIVTIIIEDYVTSPKGLTKVFNAAGLRKYWFPVSRMPKNGGDWPTVDDMVQKNQRLVVFTSKAAKEASEGIAYEWRYLVENQCKYKFQKFKLTLVLVTYAALIPRIEGVFAYLVSDTCRCPISTPTLTHAVTFNHFHYLNYYLCLSACVCDVSGISIYVISS